MNSNQLYALPIHDDVEAAKVQLHPLVDLDFVEGYAYGTWSNVWEAVEILGIDPDEIERW